MAPIAPFLPLPLWLSMGWDIGDIPQLWGQHPAVPPFAGSGGGQSSPSPCSWSESSIGAAPTVPQTRIWGGGNAKALTPPHPPPKGLFPTACPAAIQGEEGEGGALLAEISVPPPPSPASRVMAENRPLGGEHQIIFSFCFRGGWLCLLLSLNCSKHAVFCFFTPDFLPPPPLEGSLAEPSCSGGGVEPPLPAM